MSSTIEMFRPFSTAKLGALVVTLGLAAVQMCVTNCSKPASDLESLHPEIEGTANFTLQIDDDFSAAPTMDKLRESVIEVLQRRLELCFRRPFFTVEEGAAADQILVQLPVSSRLPDRFLRLLVSGQGRIEWRMLIDEPSETKERLLAFVGGELPESLEILRGAGVSGDYYYLVEKTPELTHEDVDAASVDSIRRPTIVFTEEGVKKMRQLSAASMGKQLAIVLDETVMTTLTVRGEIGRSAVLDLVDEELRVTFGVLIALAAKEGTIPARLTILSEDRT